MLLIKLMAVRYASPEYVGFRPGMLASYSVIRPDFFLQPKIEKRDFITNSIGAKLQSLAVLD